MQVNARTAERIANDLREYLGQGKLAYVSHNETEGRVETFSTGHHLERGDWTDYSPESVRIFQHDDGRVWIGFSIAGWFFSIQEGELVGVDRSNGVKIRFTAPCGDKRLDWLKRQ